MSIGRWAVVCAGLILGWPAQPASAQAAAPRFGISDNSFLVEEAFNQEAGIFQNIFVVVRTRDGRWDGSFTQEWPIGGQRHQVSFSLPFAADVGGGRLGDVLINYRLQVWTEGERRPAFSPRISAVFASEADRRSLGLGGTGWQMNLPFSKQFGPFYVHANAGATWLKTPADTLAGTPEQWTSTSSGAASAIWAARPMFHLMLECYGQSTQQPDGTRERTITTVPGFRTGWNLGDRQLVVGVGAALTRGDVHINSLLLYSSFELPFVKK
jgi:hypothetical protein